MLYLCIGVVIVNIVLLLLSVTRRKTLWWILLFGYELVGCVASLLVVAFYDSLPTSGPMPGLAYAAETFSALRMCGVLPSCL